MEATANLEETKENIEIDFSKSQLLISLQEDLIVLSNGNQEENTFEGTILISKTIENSIGVYSKEMKKSKFKVLKNKKVILINK